jgi:hypothetical protein
MKILKNILIGFLSIVIFILSLAFIVIEGRLLFSLDWIIYDNTVFVFLRYLFRFMISLFTLVYAILEFINMKKKSEKLNYILFIYNICLFGTSIFLIIYATNMVGEIALCISLVMLLVKVIFMFLKTNKKL